VKTVPLQGLKEQLSALVNEAEAGERIVVTRGRSRGSVNHCFVSLDARQNQAARELRLPT